MLGRNFIISVEESTCISPATVFFFLLSSRCFLAVVHGLEVIHVGHVRSFGHAGHVDIGATHFWELSGTHLRPSTGATSRLTSIHLLILSVFILSFGFFLTVKHHELLTELLVLHAEILSNLD